MRSRRAIALAAAATLGLVAAACGDDDDDLLVAWEEAGIFNRVELVAPWH